MIPGAALRKLSAMTGLEASKIADSCYKLEITPEVAYVSFLRDEKEACVQLRQMNLGRVNQIVFERQEWKCHGCQERRPLQGHHVIYRSRWRPAMGPLDWEGNIVGVCSDCHESEHRGE